MNHENEILDYLGESGILADKINTFEYRESQVDMACRVMQAFNEDGILAADAGTGTGKSFAYLLPAILFCNEHSRERVIIATSTINLQHQIVEKDIPFLRETLNINIKTAILKGRTNYLCLRKLNEILQELPFLSSSESGELERLKDWAAVTDSGMRSEIDPPVSWKSWLKVCSESDGCLKNRCPYREDCYVLSARKKAAESQIVIINHHLLFADIVMREHEQIEEDEQAILPPYQRLIIDEAHNIEKNATSYFTDMANGMMLGRIVGDLYYRKGRRRSGILLRAAKFFQEGFKADDIENMQLAVLQASDALEVELEGMLKSLNRSSFLVEAIDNYPTGTLPGNSAKPVLFDFCTLNSAIDRVRGAVRKISKYCGNLRESMPDNDDALPFVVEIQQNRNKLDKVEQLLSRFLKFREYPDDIFWIDTIRHQNGQKSIQMNITPVSVSEALYESIFEAKKSIICTSATLAAGADFSYWERQVGLAGKKLENYKNEKYNSPFNYRKHLYLGIPTDIAQPEISIDSGYRDDICRFCVELITASEGGTLVLFTSYALLKYVHAYLASPESGLDSGLALLVQGDQDRSKLMKRFVEDHSSVLLATESFWEGVDAPGDTLRSVIITRIPFQVPTNPVVAARYKAYEQAGGNSFIDIAVPEAALRLKQGFGRLIRRRTDRGGVFILDSRIISKFYGRKLLEVLPETVVDVHPLSRIIENFENFLYSSG